MLSTIKSIVRASRERCRAEREHREIIRQLDALAMTELGFPPKDARPKRRAFAWAFWRVTPFKSTS